MPNVNHTAELLKDALRNLRSAERVARTEGWRNAEDHRHSDGVIVGHLVRCQRNAVTALQEWWVVESVGDAIRAYTFGHRQVFRRKLADATKVIEREVAFIERAAEQEGEVA